MPKIPRKHLIITGVPRAGKSTLARRVSRKFGYQHISMDSIIAGFEQCFPETGVDTNAPKSSEEILVTISRKMAPFLRAMMSMDEYDELNEPMVIDMYQLLPEDYEKYIDKELCDILYLVTGDVTPEERFQIQKKFDTPQDYSYYLSDEERMEGCEYLVEQSKLFHSQCETYGLPCYETSRNREQVMEQILEKLESTCTPQ